MTSAHQHTPCGGIVKLCLGLIDPVSERSGWPNEKAGDEKLERETGIEPATSSLGSWRSTAELLPLTPTRSLAALGISPAGSNARIPAQLGNGVLPLNYSRSASVARLSPRLCQEKAAASALSQRAGAAGIGQDVRSDA